MKEEENCGSCWRCLERAGKDNPLVVLTSRYVLCSTCGNKRCPKATDHRLKCSNSNLPGQPGSIYV